MATGLTVTEAKDIMRKYLATSLPAYPGIYYGTYGGSPDAHSNCTLFSQWFLKTYTTDAVKIAQPSGNGMDMVQYFINANPGKVSVGTKPTAFSLFSITANNGYYQTGSAGHTGIVLGVDGDTVITGEANYNSPYGGLDASFPNNGTVVQTHSASTFNSSTGVTFVNLNNYIVDSLKGGDSSNDTTKKDEEEDMTEFAFSDGSAIYYVTGSKMIQLKDATQWSVLQSVYSQVEEHRTGKAQKIKIFDWKDNPTAGIYKKICGFN